MDAKLYCCKIKTGSVHSELTANQANIETEQQKQTEQRKIKWESVDGERTDRT